MNCPTDGETLLLAERQGVEIDYCPRCRGVWLDRGELDKLLAAVERDDDRSTGRRRDDDDDDDRYRDDRYRDDRYRDERSFEGGRSFDPRRKKKKSSFLSEMFEFGD